MRHFMCMLFLLISFKSFLFSDPSFKSRLIQSQSLCCDEYSSMNLISIKDETTQQAFPGQLKCINIFLKKNNKFHEFELSGQRLLKTIFFAFPFSSFEILIFFLNPQVFKFHQNFNLKLFILTKKYPKDFFHCIFTIVFINI